MRAAWLALPGILLVLTSRTPARGAGTPEPVTAPARVTLQQGADLQATVQALAGALRGVAAADPSSLAQTLKVDLKDAPLDRALPQLSLDLDRFIIRRGRALALQRRFSDPHEEIDLEDAELRRMATEMYRLFQPFAPRLQGLRVTQAQREFLDGLTAEQEARMLNGGLPLVDLPPQQRARWLDLNNQKLCTSVLYLSRAAQALTQWEQVVIREVVPGNRRDFSVQWPNGAQPDGVDVTVFGPGTPRRLKPEVVLLDARRRKAPAGLADVLSFPYQQTTLEAFSCRFREAGGPELAVPEYARKRHLAICSAGATRDEVLGALEDLWGWELVRARKGYRLGPPQLTPAADPTDLRAKLRRAIPPPVAHAVRALCDDRATDRLGLGMDLVYEAATRKQGADWKQCRAAELELTNQRRLQMTVVLESPAAGYGDSGRESEPPPWALHPEQGVLTLNGSLGPDSHPLIFFKFPGGGGWGWVANMAQYIGDGKASK